MLVWINSTGVIRKPVERKTGDLTTTWTMKLKCWHFFIERLLCLGVLKSGTMVAMADQGISSRNTRHVLPCAKKRMS